MQSFSRQRLTFQKSDARLHISLQEFKCQQWYMSSATLVSTKQDFSFVLYKTNSWTLRLLHSQRGSPYDDFICLMLIQRNMLWFLASLHEFSGTLVQGRQAITFRWNCISSLCWPSRSRKLWFPSPWLCNWLNQYLIQAILHQDFQACWIHRDLYACHMQDLSWMKYLSMPSRWICQKLAKNSFSYVNTYCDRANIHTSTWAFTSSRKH